MCGGFRVTEQEANVRQQENCGDRKGCIQVKYNRNILHSPGSDFVRTSSHC